MSDESVAELTGRECGESAGGKRGWIPPRVMAGSAGWTKMDDIHVIISEKFKCIYYLCPRYSVLHSSSPAS